MGMFHVKFKIMISGQCISDELCRRMFSLVYTMKMNEMKKRVDKNEIFRMRFQFIAKQIDSTRSFLCYSGGLCIQPTLNTMSNKNKNEINKSKTNTRSIQYAINKQKNIKKVENMQKIEIYMMYKVKQMKDAKID